MFGAGEIPPDREEQVDIGCSLVGDGSIGGEILRIEAADDDELVGVSPGEQRESHERLLCAGARLPGSGLRIQWRSPAGIRRLRRCAPGRAIGRHRPAPEIRCARPVLPV